jgi:hypothetical protein
MSEYIVEVSDLEESYYKYSDVKPETVFGHRLRERIVRCRDCEYGIHFFHHDDERWQCTNEMLEGLDVFSDFFCAWGERKEGGDD